MFTLVLSSTPVAWIGRACLCIDLCSKCHDALNCLRVVKSDMTMQFLASVAPNITNDTMMHQGATGQRMFSQSVPGSLVGQCMQLWPEVFLCHSILSSRGTITKHRSLGRRFWCSRPSVCGHLATGTFEVNTISVPSGKLLHASTALRSTLKMHLCHEIRICPQFQCIMVSGLMSSEVGNRRGLKGA